MLRYNRQNASRIRILADSNAGALRISPICREIVCNPRPAKLGALGAVDVNRPYLATEKIRERK